LRIHQVELEIQNEELRKSQAENERSRRAYQDLWELSPVGYLIIDFADRVTLKLAAAFPNILLRIEDNGRGHGLDGQGIGHRKTPARDRAGVKR